MQKENKSLKEERYTKPDNFKDPFAILRDPDYSKKLEFEDRTLQFWNEIDGIIELLNNTDPKHTQTTIESPQVTHFLLWRLLNEIKGLKIEQKKVSDIVSKKEEAYLREPNKAR